MLAHRMVENILLLNQGSSISLDSFNVIYDFTTETISSISLRTVSDSKYYGALDLKKVN